MLWLAGEVVNHVGYMDLRQPRVYWRSNVGLVLNQGLDDKNSLECTEYFHASPTETVNCENLLRYQLAYWGRDKMAKILHTESSNTFPE